MSSNLILLSSDSTNHIDAYKTLSTPGIIIKELIENSIDAKSTEIQIHASNKLTSIEVHDNGTGIEELYLNDLCKRFYSTKIESYDDLFTNNFNSRGFKGEALAIMSYLSTLTIKTKSIKESLDSQGVVITFIKGKFISKINAYCESGTTVILDKLYLDNSCLRNSLDVKQEHEFILQIVQQYSIQFPQISFTLIITQDGDKSKNHVAYTTNNERYNNLRKDYKTEILKDRIIGQFLRQKIENNLVSIEHIIESHNCNFQLLYTKPSTKIYQSNIIVFINDRMLIKNNKLRSHIKFCYENQLIKGGNFFVYVNIQLPQNCIDVNCSSDKTKIIIKNEDEIYKEIAERLLLGLKEENNSVNLYSGEYTGFKAKNSQNNNTDVVTPKEKIRSDVNSQTLEIFLAKNKISNNEISISLDVNVIENTDDKYNDSEKADIIKSIFNIIFKSGNTNIEATNIIKGNIFVGVDNDLITYVQYCTSLYSINTRDVVEDFIVFYYMSLLSGNSDNKLFSLISLNVEAKEVNEYSLDLIIEFSESKLEINESNKMTKYKISDLYKSLQETKEYLKVIGIYLSDDLKLKSIKIPKINYTFDYIDDIDFFLPMIYYFVVRCCNDFIKRKDEVFNINEFTHTHLLIELIKMLSRFITDSIFIKYDELVSNENNGSLLVNYKSLLEYIFNQIKTSKYFFRRSIEMNIDEYIEKITDTETLYTVFERC